MRKRCLYCKKILIRKKYKSKSASKGWKWESLYHFLNRKNCNLSCNSKLGNKQMGNTIWTREKVIKRFKAIKNEKKWNLDWLRDNHSGLARSIQTIYGKNHWRKFIIEMDREPLRDYTSPKRIRIARLLLKYWKEELEIKERQVFEYSSSWGLPMEGGFEFHNWNTDNAINYLKENKIIRRIKIGTHIPGNYSCSQYILLKTTF